VWGGGDGGLLVCKFEAYGSYTHVLQGHIKLSQVWVVSETCHCSEGTVVCRAGVSDT
jgi:hypothetical protein